MCAVPAFVCEASMMLMLAPAGIPGGVTFVHVVPASRVSCTIPLPVPTQIWPAETGEGTNAEMAPPPTTGPVRRPGTAGLESGVVVRTVRSDEICLHVCALSLETSTYCAPM